MKRLEFIKAFFYMDFYRGLKKEGLRFMDFFVVLVLLPCLFLDGLFFHILPTSIIAALCVVQMFYVTKHSARIGQKK